MKRKFKLIVPSFLAIVFCLLLIAGSTFALFTSEASASISVTSGKVDVSAELIDLKAYSAKAVDAFQSGDEEAGTISTGNYASKYIYEPLEADNAESTQYTFTTGGSVELNTATQALSLERMVAGDRVTLKLKLTNESNVNVKYRVRLNALTDNGLLENLTFNLGNLEDETVEKLVGVIKVGAWHEWQVPANEAEKTKTISLELFLPLENESMNSKNIDDESGFKSTLKFTVEMVQANAKVDEVLDLVNAYLADQNPRNKTMWDAIQDANAWLALPENAGKSFTATNYVWNMDTDQFYAEGNVVTGQGFESRFFKAYTYDEFQELTNPTYGIYAYGEGWPTDELEINHSFDQGDVSIQTITYDRQDAAHGKEVVVRTNSMDTSLIVNAPKDVVHHYGPAGYLKIEAIANSSYHENGQVGFVEISKGRVALEEGAQVTQLHISSIKDDNGTTTNEFSEIIVAIHEDVDKPTFSRDDVEIASTGTLVVALQEGTADVTEDTELDYVWLTKQGIFEQIKVSDSKEEITEEAKWADELTAGTTKSAAQEIANNFNKNLSVTVEVQDGETVVEKTYKVAINEDRDLVVVEAVENPDLDNPIATIDEDGQVTIGNNTVSKTYSIELSKNNTTKATELVVTNVNDADDKQTVKSVEQSGISSDDIDEYKDEIIAVAKYKEFIDAGYSFVVGNTGYTSLKAAFDNVQDNQTITLIKDVELTISPEDVNSETFSYWQGSGVSSNYKIYSYIHMNNKKGIVFDLNDHKLDVDYSFYLIDAFPSGYSYAAKAFIYLSGDGSLDIRNGEMNIKFEYKNRAATATGSSVYTTGKYAAIFVHNSPAAPVGNNPTATYDIPYQTKLSMVNCSLTTNQIPLYLSHGALVTELNANLMLYFEELEKTAEGKGSNIYELNIQNGDGYACIYADAGSKINEISGGTYYAVDQRIIDYYAGITTIPFDGRFLFALRVAAGFDPNKINYPNVHVPNAVIEEISGGTFASNSQFNSIMVYGRIDEISGGLFKYYDGTFINSKNKYINAPFKINAADCLGSITGGTFISGCSTSRPEPSNNVIRIDANNYPNFISDNPWLSEGYEAVLNEDANYTFDCGGTVGIITFYAYDVKHAE